MVEQDDLEIECRLLAILDDFMEQPTRGCAMPHPRDALLMDTIESEFDIELPERAFFTVQEVLDHITFF
jgi:hypothetical protein